MGQEIGSETFSDKEFAHFKQQLVEETATLANMFHNCGFSEGEHVGGFELEAWLVGANAQPVPGNQQFLAELDSAYVVPELSKFNFEINVQPQILTGPALSVFRNCLSQTWQRCRDVAGKLGLDVMSIGIHPQLEDSQLVLAHMSGGRRYRALNEQVLRLRNQSPITLDIRGREHLMTQHSDVMLEAATTSFQIHLQVRQEQAVRAYNAAQIVSAPLLAVSANSPYLFGMDLWDESRIPLFEQAVNTGRAGKQRVTLGDAYVQNSLFECFSENVADYPVLIPAQSAEPKHTLPHLRLHNGTIWRWNRPLLGFNDDGQAHLRIENRVVPSGPTVEDMMANAAFFWGLVETLIYSPQVAEEAMPFAVAKANFYRAVQHSLDANLQWLDGRVRPCTDLVLNELLPMAKDGLERLQVDEAGSRCYLEIIENRVRTKQNGACWQRAWVAKHGRDMKRLSSVYLQNQHSGRPVHEWEI